MRAKKNLVLVIVMVLASLLLGTVLLAGPLAPDEKELIICDVHCNRPRIVKEDGSIEFADHLYIQNQTDHAYDLTGLYLSDEARDLTKFPLDGIVLESGERKMIRLDPSWNFALKRSGDEHVYLSDADGKILYHYMPDMKPKQPAVSADSGFYTHDFDVKITAKGHQKIYYTLDGSAPDEGSNLYEGAIRIYDRSEEPDTVVNAPGLLAPGSEEAANDVPSAQPVTKAFILRAIACDDYGNKSEIVTRTYFFCKDAYPRILSVVADREELFGPDGIMVTGSAYDAWAEGGMEGDEVEPNFHKKGKEWEVPADIEYFEGTKSVLTQRCGLRLQGRTSRDLRLKNFQLIARNRYSGRDSFSYDLFRDPIPSDALILDDSFEEAFFYSLVEDEPILSPQVTQGIALFLNGEYWKDVYIRQKLDEKYFADHFGVAEENLVVLSESFADIGFWEEDRGPYLALDEQAQKDLSDPEEYERICSMMDMDSYIDYLAIDAYAGNYDWGEYENDLVWRVREPDGTVCGDGRFRWILHDCDHIFDPEENFLNNRFVTDSVLFDGLMKNPDFRRRLADKILSLSDTAFRKERVEEALNAWDDHADKEKIKAFFADREEMMHMIAEEITQTKDTE